MGSLKKMHLPFSMMIRPPKKRLDLLSETLHFVRVGARHKPLWLDAAIAVSPPNIMRGGYKPPQIVYPEDRLAAIYRARNRNSNNYYQLLVGGVFKGLSYRFARKQLRVMKRGYDQETAYEKVMQQWAPNQDQHESSFRKLLHRAYLYDAKPGVNLHVLWAELRRGQSNLTQVLNAEQRATSVRAGVMERARESAEAKMRQAAEQTGIVHPTITPEDVQTNAEQEAKKESYRFYWRRAKSPPLPGTAAGMIAAALRLHSSSEQAYESPVEEVIALQEQQQQKEEAHAPIMEIEKAEFDMLKRMGVPVKKMDASEDETQTPTPLLPATDETQRQLVAAGIPQPASGVKTAELTPEQISQLLQHQLLTAVDAKQKRDVRRAANMFSVPDDDDDDEAAGGINDPLLVLQELRVHARMRVQQQQQEQQTSVDAAQGGNPPPASPPLPTGSPPQPSPSAPVPPVSTSSPSSHLSPSVVHSRQQRKLRELATMLAKTPAERRRLLVQDMVTEAERDAELDVLLNAAKQGAKVEPEKKKTKTQRDRKGKKQEDEYGPEDMIQIDDDRFNSPELQSRAGEKKALDLLASLGGDAATEARASKMIAEKAAAAHDKDQSARARGAGLAPPSMYSASDLVKMGMTPEELSHVVNRLREDDMSAWSRRTIQAASGKIFEVAQKSKADVQADRARKEAKEDAKKKKKSGKK